MLALIFFWTPPHFWSLAIYYKEDFRSSGYPVLPLVQGEEKTWKSIFFCAVLTVLSSLTPLVAGTGMLYLLCAVVLGAWFLAEIIRAQRGASRGAARRVFVDSIVYLVGVVVAVMVERTI